MQLRKLTVKSTLKFGKYSANTVDEKLKSVKGRNYLRWVYFNCSHIDFFPDILFKLNIHTDMLITKPGKDIPLYNKVRPTIEEAIIPSGYRPKRGMKEQRAAEALMNKKGILQSKQQKKYYK